MMRALYSLSVFVYGRIIFLASFFHQKAKLLHEGREESLNKYQRFNILSKGKKKIWIHCASLGEFEQARPVIEQLRKDFPDSALLLSFFSPSGYEVRKHFEAVDVVCYMPEDLTKDLNNFLDTIQPDLALFVKYEFWFNTIYLLHQRKIPIIYFSVIFRNNHPYFKPWASWFRKQFLLVDAFFVQDQTSASLLQSSGHNNTIVAGDTRFDRVIQNKNKIRSIEKIERFVQGKTCIVCGSTWLADDKLIIPSVIELLKKDSNLKCIIAPHHTHPERINELVALIPEGLAVRYSAFHEQESNSPFMIIDNMGMLSSIYQYGTLAYVGGGFNGAVHNTLEPAVFGIPVVFGPAWQKFNEINDLLQLQVAQSISNKQELTTAIISYLDKSKNETISSTLSNYFEKKKGATPLIVDAIRQVLISNK